jgi:preprotein translocase subunit SecG
MTNSCISDLPLTIREIERYNPVAVQFRRLIALTTTFDIALIITSIALIASIILQSKGIGLGGLTGGDTGGVFTARRGIEKTLFWITIGLSVVFFVLAIVTVLVSK